MSRFIKGEERGQLSLLPTSLDDFVEDDNPVRVVDAFIDALALGELGFTCITPAATGRPAYHPAMLLKLYLYGYLNRAQSSRRLEREARRNVEVMWLTSRLTPDFKTIADFRRNNGAGIQSVCAKFVEICVDIGLFKHGVAAIDGAKFKAVNRSRRLACRQRRHGIRRWKPPGRNQPQERRPNDREGRSVAAGEVGHQAIRQS